MHGELPKALDDYWKNYSPTVSSVRATTKVFKSTKTNNMDPCLFYTKTVSRIISEISKTFFWLCANSKRGSLLIQYKLRGYTSNWSECLLGTILWRFSWVQPPKSRPQSRRKKTLEKQYFPSGLQMPGDLPGWAWKCHWGEGFLSLSPGSVTDGWKKNKN